MSSPLESQANNDISELITMFDSLDLPSDTVFDDDSGKITIEKTRNLMERFVTTVKSRDSEGTVAYHDRPASLNLTQEEKDAFFEDIEGKVKQIIVKLKRYESAEDTAPFLAQIAIAAGHSSPRWIEEVEQVLEVLSLGTEASPKDELRKNLSVIVRNAALEEDSNEQIKQVNKRSEPMHKLGRC